MKKIIISEDIKSILDEEKSFLNRSDIKTFAAPTNEQVLAFHRAEKADLIITNLDAPEMSGEKLSSLVREDDRICDVSLIIICPNTETALKRCLQCRANAFVTIPINNAVLLQEAYQLLHIAPRKAFRAPLSIQMKGKSGKTAFIGYAANISVSGLLLYSDTLLFEGDPITCSFYLSYSKHMTADAEVTRLTEKGTEHDTNGYGVRFIDLKDEYRSAIEEFVSKLGLHR